MESTTYAEMSLLLEQQSFLRKELKWAQNDFKENGSPMGKEYAELVERKLQIHDKEVNRIYIGVATNKILLVKNGIIQ